MLGQKTDVIIIIKCLIKSFIAASWLSIWRNYSNVSSTTTISSDDCIIITITKASQSHTKYHRAQYCGILEPVIKGDNTDHSYANPESLLPPPDPHHHRLTDIHHPTNNYHNISQPLHHGNFPPYPYRWLRDFYRSIDTENQSASPIISTITVDG